jgi:hypothetical protein
VIKDKMFKKELREYKQYLLSEYWEGIKEQVLKRDDYKCTSCQSEENLQIHHESYECLGNEDINKLTTLCKKCHYKYHKRYGGYYLGYLYEQYNEKCKIKYEQDKNDAEEYFSKYQDIIDKEIKKILKEYHYISKQSFEDILFKFIDTNDLISEQFNKEMYICSYIYFFSLKNKKEIMIIETSNYNDIVKNKHNLPDDRNIIIDKVYFKNDVYNFSIFYYYVNCNKLIKEELDLSSARKNTLTK